MPDDTSTPAMNDAHLTSKDATENSPAPSETPNQTTVIMYLKETESPTPKFIPAKPAETCSHFQTVCSLCVRWWALDWTIDFDATTAGRELLALRRALDAK